MTRNTAWLPKARVNRGFASWPLWQPPRVPQEKLEKLSYIVVDEIVAPTCVLAVSEWPRVDDKGRLRFRLSKRPQLVRVAARDLMKHLATHRLPRKGSQRELRIGDVFAAVADKDRLPKPQSDAEAHKLAGSSLTPVETWLDPPIYDVTASARDAAKVALYSAVAPTLTPDEVKRLSQKG
jgi:hypothetical protein